MHFLFHYVYFFSLFEALPKPIFGRLGNGAAEVESISAAARCFLAAELQGAIILFSGF